MAPLLENKNGVRIEIYGREHLPVHIHAKYGEYEALVNIRTGEVFEGSLPSKKLRIVQDWLDEGNRRELIEKNFYELNPRLALKEVEPEVEQDETKENDN
ncbi:MAG: hypothetical protein A3D31_01090 [Candidatus Fluviicola riflensis]|nr:MAG: hypothetical protein CHH17_04450 [Candidatus Fluviicola riflensis]OGS76201.1 MAG: hypothetical protein A3D31_01090 [Candidatus Fluviicola riflensis]OGS83255.1 MAG: hypothetical protein A2724_00750 [Fluviicola sp. RIFCSPHIGHO2_01_FULL_43_53]OGS83733.1 MAG: hypothetical protein A3E30_17695 [Fluviicola sp. RIFCSPHIGHO2_12_FULL_43_24]